MAPVPIVSSPLFEEEVEGLEESEGGVAKPGRLETTQSLWESCSDSGLRERVRREPMQKMRRAPSRALCLLEMLVVVILCVSVFRTHSPVDQCVGSMYAGGWMKNDE